MPFILILFGVYVIVVAIRGYITTLGTLLKGDLVGSGSFGLWLIAIMVVGTLGYVGGAARTFSRAFLLLIVVVLFLSNGGVWAKLITAIKNPAPALPTQTVTVSGGAASSGSAGATSSSSGGGNPLTGAIGSIVGSALGGIF